MNPQIEPVGQPNSSGAMAQATIAFIQQRPATTFVELINHLREIGQPVDGEINIHIEPPNIFLWFNVTQDLADCLADLVARQVVYLRPSNLLVYVFDGGVPRLPIAKRVTAAGYKKPHWLPVVFWPALPRGKSKEMATE